MSVETHADPAPTNGSRGGRARLVRHETTRPQAHPRVQRYVWGVLAAALAVILFPWLSFTETSHVGRANLAGQYALVAISLVVLTGWVGQVSLGQAAFVGVGAYLTGTASEAWGIGFPISIVVGAFFGALASSLLGIVALRVRGLYLAVATLIFSWTADAFLFQQEWLTRHSAISLDPLGEPEAVPYIDFGSRRSYYYAIWAVVALCVFLMANLRDRKIGRAFFAVRGSEMAAASLGIDVVRTKLLAFAVSGALAGLAGSMTLVGSQVVTVDQFNLSQSLFFLAIAVVGGLTSLGGAIASATFFAGLEEVFFRVPAIGEYLRLVSAVLLAAVVLLYPGGLAALGHTVADMFRRHGPAVRRPMGIRAPDAPEDGSAPEAHESRVEARVRVPRWAQPIYAMLLRPLERLQATRQAKRRVQQASMFLDFSTVLDETEEGPEPAIVTEVSANGKDEERVVMSWEQIEIPEVELPDRSVLRPLIEAEHITVRFGGLTAVNDFSLTIREGEIVGLIGPNGAGKTTLFNSIAGFNTPTEGRVRLHGLDVTDFPIYLRSRLGVARTFQVIQLFPQLDVFQNLLVATYMSDSSGLFGSMIMTGRSLQEEVRARGRVSEIIEILGLEDVAHRQVSELPFGVLRMVEIARALVTGAPVIMLDEPASGLDDVETQRLARLIRFIRSLGVTILLIEHDVQMVTGISDYMYVIDQGTPIAEGTPQQIKRDPVVIAAYLGEEHAETGDVEVQPASVP